MGTTRLVRFATNVIRYAVHVWDCQQIVPVVSVVCHYSITHVYALAINTRVPVCATPVIPNAKNVMVLQLTALNAMHLNLLPLSTMIVSVVRAPTRILSISHVFFVITPVCNVSDPTQTNALSAMEPIPPIESLMPTTKVSAFLIIF